MRWIVSVITVLVLVAGLWWMEQRRQAELAPQPDASSVPQTASPEPRYPLPETLPQSDSAPAPTPPKREHKRQTVPPIHAEPEPEPPPPLPELPESDASALETLSNLFDGSLARQWIKPEFVIPRTVAVINSFDGDAPALESWPVSPVNSAPEIEEREDGKTRLWTQASAERYGEHVAALGSVPPAQAAAVYVRYYPLFQQAWGELGEAEPYFNDRLIDVIDHLLATPEAGLPIEVVPYEGHLRFSDHSLQDQSWGRKLLIRAGPQHARTIKRWLQEFKASLTETTATEPDA